MNEIHTLDSKRDLNSTLLVDPAGQKPNTLNSDLV